MVSQGTATVFSDGTSHYEFARFAQGGRATGSGRRPAVTSR